VGRGSPACRHGHPHAQQRHRTTSTCQPRLLSPETTVASGRGPGSTTGRVIGTLVPGAGPCVRGMVDRGVLPAPCGIHPDAGRIPWVPGDPGRGPALPLRRLPAERCPGVASHEGGETFPVVGAGWCGTSATNGAPGPTMFRYCGLTMARAPSSAVRAREGSNRSSRPVARARSQAWVASSARYVSTTVAPLYSSPHGTVNLDDHAVSTPHATAASAAARRS
jgi:hypothetical protein